LYIVWCKRGLNSVAKKSPDYGILLKTMNTSQGAADKRYDPAIHRTRGKNAIVTEKYVLSGDALNAIFSQDPYGITGPVYCDPVIRQRYQAYGDTEPNG